MNKKINKSQLLALCKQATNIECEINYENNLFTGTLKGEIMKKREKEINLKSIYELILNLKDENNVKFQLLENRFESLENRFESLENRIESLENKVESLGKKIDRVISLNNLKF